MAVTKQTLKGVNHTKATGTLMDLIAAGQWRGKVRVMMDTVELISASALTTIKLGQLDKGDYVLPNSFIMHDALGAGVKLMAGDDLSGNPDADRYLEATLASAAGVIQLNDAATCINKVPLRMSADCNFYLTTSAATANGTIKSFLFVAHE